MTDIAIGHCRCLVSQQVPEYMRSDPRGSCSRHQSSAQVMEPDVFEPGPLRHSFERAVHRLVGDVSPPGRERYARLR